jgi:hypothetical protein
LNETAGSKYIDYKNNELQEVQNHPNLNVKTRHNLSGLFSCKNFTLETKAITSQATFYPPKPQEPLSNSPSKLSKIASNKSKKPL